MRISYVTDYALSFRKINMIINENELVYLEYSLFLPLSFCSSCRVVRRWFHDTIIHVITVRASLSASLEIFDVHCNYWNMTDTSMLYIIKCVAIHILLLITPSYYYDH